jgi:hypothetical protein
MRLRLPGLPFVLDFNGFMLAGTAVFAVGVAGYVAGEFGAFGPGSSAGSLFFGATLAGLALYGLGRIVQLVAHFRNRRP